MKTQTFFGEVVGDRAAIVDGCVPYDACKRKQPCWKHSEWEDRVFNEMCKRNDEAMDRGEFPRSLL